MHVFYHDLAYVAIKGLQMHASSWKGIVIPHSLYWLGGWEYQGLDSTELSGNLYESEEGDSYTGLGEGSVFISADVFWINLITLYFNPSNIHKFLKNVVQFSVQLLKLSPKKKESLNFFGKMWWKSFFGNTHKTRKKLHSKNFNFSENWMTVSCLSFHQNLPKLSELKYTTFNMLLFEVQIFAKISQKWKLGNADSMLYQCCSKIVAEISEKMIVNTRCVLCFMCMKNHEQNNAFYWKIRKLTIFK